MRFKALLDDRQDLLIHQAPDRVLHHALFFSQRSTNVEQIERVQHGGSTR